jgi:D-tyrosyl-tRNA(Tyr) deacylase
MRAVLQRVREASVTVDGAVVGQIGAGLLVLLGVGKGDTEADVEWMVDKVPQLRIFEDDAGKMNRSALDVGGGVLVISQFTLYADSRKGRRPSFTDAAAPDVAAPLVDYYAERLRAEGIQRVEFGVFGAMMLVEIHNDGPVTILLDSAELA